ncbi:Tryptophan--tRNA ligase [uncultured Ruminococcus sp.]|uniref:Tryptophan--tRNA ligase n=1 Tax=Massiliimalia timonensis TaxID=1987501 RepID=A0A8J6P024_9FIRM|nr:tryptophan--tRNA ligase [Massiliimalia timonensis]MBC8610189.1 tryptophan--tRNA ligase [Massiliimalia timonensis]SCH05350.1 Tryptophan--tRNA ligase [uncultured Ruminococcus sp.]SCH75164.1 Tryptophan--tRNA ligase [uncultured Clostridium sp.]
MADTQEKKQIILSGIQPTGTFTLGNYIGAIRNWVKLQEEYDCAYMIADMHALTVRQDPVKLRQQILSAFAVLLACGVDPKKSLTFIQSQVHQHAELNWVLACNTQFGELSRMTQFKDKSAKHPENINAGLFTYPALMAADILLYQANLVPVGVDQKQHLEITRDIANRFNNNYGQTFTIPEPYIPEIGAKVMSLAEPTKKMSKSDENQNAFITILDAPEVIIKKFKRAVTDSDMEIRYAEGKDGINNLMSIYSTITGDSYETIERDFSGKGYGDFKTAVGEAVAEALRPIRENYDRLIKDKAYLEETYHDGAQKAAYLAEKTMRKVYRKVGFLAK